MRDTIITRPPSDQTKAFTRRFVIVSAVALFWAVIFLPALLESSESLTYIILGFIVFLTVSFFTGFLLGRRRRDERKRELGLMLGLSEEEAAYKRHRPVVGTLDDVPVAIRFNTATGKSWDHEEDRHDSVTTIEETAIIVGAQASPPTPPEVLRELGVEAEDRGWVWRGDGDVLGDRRVEPLIRMMVREWGRVA